MEYAHIRTMDPRDWTANPFNYLTSYSISKAQLVDNHDEEEARAINAEATWIDFFIKDIFFATLSRACNQED